MKLRSIAPKLRDWKGTGRMTTDPSVSPNGTPMLVIDGPDGGPVEPAEAYIYGYEVLEARKDELDMLREGGYAIPYMGE